MRWRLIVLVLTIFSASLIAQGNNEEFRSTWVITWDHISAGSTVEQNKANVRKIMDEHKAANMNAVLWQARQGGTAYYNSSIEPWGSYAGGSDPGYDPLAYAIEQAHMRGLELHAWFNTFHASSTVDGAPAAEHPEWVCTDGSGTPMPARRALSPGMKAVRDYTIDVAMEIVNNYDIDGLHLDYIRWNEYNIDFPFNEPTIPEEAYRTRELDGIFEEPNTLDNSLLKTASVDRFLYDVDHPYSAGIPSGYASWEEYWRASVTTFVQTLHDSIQSQKPWVRLSAAALGKYKDGGDGGAWNGYYRVYQDAALWFNEGYIDQLTPMHYHWTTGSGFTGILNSDWLPNIGPGIAAGRLYSVGPYSYQFGVEGVWAHHESVVQAVRTVNWVDGFQFFSYGDWEGYEYFPDAGSSFFSKKTKIRKMGTVTSETPITPSISITAIDPLTYDVIITPDASVTSNHWWVLYRSTANDIDVSASNILGTYFGDSEFSVRQAFDGTQNHNGSYFYSATMLDRFWNESSPAPSAESNVLESLAPIMASTFPADGDTVDVSSVINLTFSKSMDKASVESALSISSNPVIDRFVWYDYDRKVNIYPQNDFEFDSSYTVTLTEAALDINGVAFDGNADGVAGGDLSFSFTTKSVDVAGPIVVYSFPEVNTIVEDFDVGGIVSIVFNEELDPATVTLDAIEFKRNGVDKDFDFLLSGYYGRAVLDIGLYEPLLGSSNYSVTIAETVTDTLGNPLSEPITISFSTFEKSYTDVTAIDNFIFTGVWWDPEGSGSTVGTVDASTVFGYTSKIYVPGSSEYSQGKKGAVLLYKWDESAPTHLLREYIPHTSVQAGVHFDNSYILQTYIYGDASNNKIRFCIDEGAGTDFATGEVSNWVTIDWEGWRLMQWDLSDPSTVGSWIGNGILEGPEFRIDSFQMTWDKDNGAVEGKIFIDQIRVVKTISTVDTDEDLTHQLPRELKLRQNYPNPFNPETRIGFDLPAAMHTKLTVYDVRGREVKTLVDQNLSGGSHTFSFDGQEWATGVYLARLETESGSQVIRMLLLK